MSLINGSRSSGLVMHSGLLAAARGHSHEMALRGGLDHDGADERVRNAPPDPFETNGAPDDGFPVAAWCENVTYVIAVSESEAPQRIYDQWNNSAPHRQCMRDTGKNVAAVGIYYDGQNWWATFIAEVDNTPPGGAPAKPKPSAADKPTTAPHPTAAATTTAPVAQPEPAASPVGLITTHIVTEPQASDAPPRATEAPRIVVEAAPDGKATTGRPAHSYAAPILSHLPPITLPLGYGWREVLAVACVLGVATIYLRRVTPRGVPLSPRPAATSVQDEMPGHAGGDVVLAEEGELTRV